MMPTGPGWWWVKLLTGRRGATPVPVEVTEFGMAINVPSLYGGLTAAPISDNGLKFVAPIPSPEVCAAVAEFERRRDDAMDIAQNVCELMDDLEALDPYRKAAP